MRGGAGGGRLRAVLGESVNSAGTDPIKAFILKGFGIVWEQAPATDVPGWARRKPH